MPNNTQFGQKTVGEEKEVEESFCDFLNILHLKYTL